MEEQMADLRPPASAVVQALGPNVTKADTIRALDRAGYSRSEIADIMGIRYQHVRNVLVDDERLAREKPLAGMAGRPPGMSESERRFESAPQLVGRITVGPDGNVDIPRDILAAAGAKEGEALLVRVVDGAIELRTPESALRRLQEYVRQLVPEGVSLADELVAERHAEAERELGED